MAEEIKYEHKTEKAPEHKHEKNEHEHKPAKDRLEREYVIPLRKAWLKVPMYERTGKAIKAIKIFLAKHMKVEDRDVNKVKIDIYLNNELWYKGRTNPPSKIKVKVVKEDGIVKVDFIEIPKHVKFLKAKHEKLQKKLEAKQPEEKAKAEKSEVKGEKTEGEKKDEKEKEASTAESKAKEFEVKAKEQKHIGKAGKTQRPQRMALQK